MTTQHTPGPWVVAQLLGDDSSIMITPVYLDGDGRNYAGTLCEVHPTGDFDSDLANARLIAAAPDLLVIATAYRNLLRTFAHTDGEVATFHHVESIILKATQP